MKLKIRDRKDFNAGLMFILIGAAFAIAATNYPMGSALRMGPAYFPTILGSILVLLGLIVLGRSFSVEGAPPQAMRWRSAFWVLASVVAFALLSGPLKAGLVLASMILIVMSAFADWEFRWKEALILAVVLTVFTVMVFYYGLGLPFRLWP